jgi:hypothetical protein
MCCGQKRIALKADGTSPTGTVCLLYSGQFPLHLRGSVTGRTYQFSRVTPVQPVDQRDATSMLQSRVFRQSRLNPPIPEPLDPITVAGKIN